MVTVYGWKELNEACYGIETLEVEGPCEFDSGTGELGYHRDVYEGCWYRTFRQAKTAALIEFKRQIRWRRQALRDIQKIKAKDVV